MFIKSKSLQPIYLGVKGNRTTKPPRCNQKIKFKTLAKRKQVKKQNQRKSKIPKIYEELATNKELYKNAAMDIFDKINEGLENLMRTLIFSRNHVMNHKKPLSILDLLKNPEYFFLYLRTTIIYLTKNFLKDLFKSNFILYQTLLELHQSAVEFNKKAIRNKNKEKLLENESLVRSYIPKVLKGTLRYFEYPFRNLSFRIEFLQLVFNTGYVNNKARNKITQKDHMRLDATFEIMKENIYQEEKIIKTKLLYNEEPPQMICNQALNNIIRKPYCTNCIFCKYVHKCINWNQFSMEELKRIHPFGEIDEIDKILINEIYDADKEFKRQEAELLERMRKDLQMNTGRFKRR